MQMECCICCDLFTGSATEDIRATNCGHVFHNGCLKDWLGRSGTCPHCRAGLREQDSIRLYLNTQQNAKISTPGIVEKLSEDETKRLIQLKTAIISTTGSLQRLYKEVENISLATTSAKESIELCANIRRKLLRNHGADGSNNSAQTDLKNTEKKISDSLDHIAVFVEKMYLTNKSLSELAENLKISGSGDGVKRSSYNHLTKPNSGIIKKNFY